MSRRYKGGVISATAPTTSTSTAKGVWTLPQQMQAIVGSGWPLIPGSQSYTTAGTYTWVAPAGVTSVSVVAVGGGGGGTRAGGGGGGELRYGNAVSVTPGSSYSVVVGARGNSGVCLSSATAGGNSTFNTSSVIAIGGKGYVFGTNPTPGGSGGTGTGGGNGGSGKTGGSGGGGGAGGYSGAGGAGGGGGSGCAGTGGAGGGGSSITTSSGSGGGGGVGLFGQGTSGAGGTSNNGGGAGSGGGAGTAGSGAVGGDGGAYGGGGGAGPNCSCTGPGGVASTGAVRIIWPGNTRSFPSTCAGSP